VPRWLSGLVKVGSSRPSLWEHARFRQGADDGPYRTLLLFVADLASALGSRFHIRAGPESSGASGQSRVANYDRQMLLRKANEARPPVKYAGIEVGLISETRSHVSKVTFWWLRH
jgi:hypothetical protein